LGFRGLGVPMFLVLSSFFLLIYVIPGLLLAGFRFSKNYWRAGMVSAIVGVIFLFSAI